MYLRDQIFHVHLEHFISEVVCKWQQDQMFLLMHFVINLQNLWASDYGSKCLKIFSVSYHWFCAKVAAEAIAIFLLVYLMTDFVRKWLREQWWFRG